MSARPWTDGPWKFGKELTARGGEWLISMDVGPHRGNPIAETIPASGSELANARLISSAPDLADALIAAPNPAEYVGRSREYANACETWHDDYARAALAKAGVK